MRPPHSAPASNGSGYSSNQYQQPQSNGLPQQINSPGNQQNPNSMSIPNSQPVPQQMPQQSHQQGVPIQHHQMGQMPSQQMNMNVVSSPMNNMASPGQIPYHQGLMMQQPHGQQLNMPQGHQNQPVNMVPPHMSMPQGYVRFFSCQKLSTL